MESVQLDDGPLVVVHAEVDQRVTELGVPPVLLDHEQRRRLLAAPVPPGDLSCGQAFDEPLGQLEMFVLLERRREGVDRLLRDEDVPLRRIAVARPPARPVVALGTGERGRATCAVDDPDLPLCAILVRGGESLDHLRRRPSLAQQGQPVRAVPGVRVRLRGDRPDVRLRPGHDRADREEFRLHSDAPLGRREVTGDDRVGGDEATAHTSAPGGRGRAGPDARAAR